MFLHRLSAFVKHFGRGLFANRVAKAALEAFKLKLSELRFETCVMANFATKVSKRTFSAKPPFGIKLKLSIISPLSALFYTLCPNIRIHNFNDFV